MRTKAKKCVVLGQPSWRLASSNVEAFVTEIGGHIGPVTFDRAGRKIQPFSVAPWATEKMEKGTPRIIEVLRGDFFCMPFGGNNTPFEGERYPIHGETANAKWKFESLDVKEGRTCLHLTLQAKIRKGRVDKKIFLIDGHNAVYSQHIVSDASGPICIGQHAMVKFPSEPGSGIISTSPFVYGQVFPGVFESPENRGYCFLKAGAEFNSLERVPTITGEYADLTRYPARRGWEDLAMIVGDASAPFAWTAVTFPKERYVWFALKDPRVLRNTVLWISNGGRHYPPWSGRHVNVMGLEEVTAYFHYGVAESARKNPISEKGYPTCVELSPKHPLVVNYIMATAAIPAGFDRVASIEVASSQSLITMKSANNKNVTALIDVGFLSQR